jgi:cytochrome c oxidase subunit 2
MNPIPFMPDQASANAVDHDWLFLFLTVITVGIGLGITSAVVYFAFRYYRKEEGEPTPRILGSLKLELAWTFGPCIFLAVMFGWGAWIYSEASRPPPDAMEVFVVGKQWMWKVQHPGGQREINEIHIPVGRPIKFTNISEDVIHCLGVPAFRFKRDVLPSRYTFAWATPTKTGEYWLFCDQLCGTGHSKMMGKIYVMEPEDYQAWLNSHAEGSPALEGRKLFFKLQCITCHTSKPTARAPVLEGTYGTRVPLKGGGSVVVDENYIRESIRNPRAKIHDGYEPIMPAFTRDEVSEDDLLKVIAFIRSLRRGETPDRNEEFPAPVGAPTTPEGRSRP